MFTMRKAKIKHNCSICNKEIKPKKRYISLNKKNIDETYINGAICENCLEEILTNAINDE